MFPDKIIPVPTKWDDVPEFIKDTFRLSTKLMENKMKDTKLNDPVNNPKHYTSHPSGVECIEITQHYNFNLGNVIKYIWRAGLKDDNAPIQDLEKARWYLDREISRRKELENEPV